MKIINNDELKNINGGGISLSAIIGIGAAVTFIAGLLDGQIKLK